MKRQCGISANMLGASDSAAAGPVFFFGASVPGTFAPDAGASGAGASVPGAGASVPGAGASGAGASVPGAGASGAGIQNKAGTPSVPPDPMYMAICARWRYTLYTYASLSGFCAMAEPSRSLMQLIAFRRSSVHSSSLSCEYSFVITNCVKSVKNSNSASSMFSINLRFSVEVSSFISRCLSVTVRRLMVNRRSLRTRS